MTTTIESGLPNPDNILADQWRKEFISDLTHGRNNLAESAKGCKEGGWYRRQLEMQIALYDAALSAIAADRNKRDGELAQERHEFKNFHRQLCKRFDYYHDEVDWKRDQVSLIEHIAKRSAAPVAGLSDEEINKIARECGWVAATDRHIAFARALSARLLPEGWVAVPRKYTENQMMAGYGVACRYGVYEAKAFNLAEDMHKAMIAAAPMPKREG